MKKHSDKNDATLVELTLLGDGDAYEELVVRHQRAVMGTAFKVTGNRYSAEDASQDAFVAAWMNLSELRDGEKFGPWVCAFAKNCARTLERHYRAAIPDISLDAIEYSGTSSGIEEPFAEDCADEIREAVEALGEKIRETVKLHYFEDRSVAEIAELLSVPVGTVKWRLSEGRKQLRKGYGIMEKTYDEKESLLSRVRRQVEALGMWRLRRDRSGFADEYRAVLQSIETLDKSKEKSSLLADTLRQGYWWIPGEKNDETFARVKKAAEEGHNDDVMMTVAAHERGAYSGDARIAFMRDMQIPYYRDNGYRKTLGYVWFWLGYEYRKKKEYEKAVECFTQVMTTLAPSDVYYANAKAAIMGEQRSLAASKDPGVIYFNPAATGEVYKKINGKLYFWEQPGYGSEPEMADGCLFYNMSRCDALMFDENMKVGDKVTSSDGKLTLALIRTDGVCDTPAGHFENCSVYVLNGNDCNMNYCESWLCDGVGLVRQAVRKYSDIYEWVLSGYRINGGEGLLPFAEGNRWSYSLATPERVCKYERENIFEVTSFERGSATVAAMEFILSRGYFDTWEGRTVEARKCYCGHTEDDDRLNDVGNALKRAEELAETKRQKLHTSVANDVMRRIFDTDPDFNPAYTEKGRWNFFELDDVRKKDGKVTFYRRQKYSFERKNMKKCGKEGYKVLYTFFMNILQDATGAVWSDKWVDGYRIDELKDGGYTTKDLTVTGGETVVTPAGTFENCRHIGFEYDAWGYFSGRSDYWFAEGVGIVRFEHPYKNDQCAVWELTRYSGKGKGFFPTDDGLFRRYEPGSLGDGWRASVEFTFDEDETGTVMFKNALGNQNREDYERSANK